MQILLLSGGLISTRDHSPAALQIHCFYAMRYLRVSIASISEAFQQHFVALQTLV